MRSSKVAQRIQDLNEKQKLRKWDDTLISYYREGIQWF